MAFERAIAATDLGPGECKEVVVGDRTLGLFNVDGTFHALANRCVHRGGPLGQGMLDGAVVTCPWHAWTFDVRTGANTEDDSLRVARFDVKVENGDVFVDVPEPVETL